jgi:large subunit ribosomal protein L4
MKCAVKNLENKDAGQIELDEQVFNTDVRDDILHRMVHWQLNGRRAGTHKAKRRGEVSGTGKKPWRQKGTGRARAGDLKRNIDRGGQTVHGPLPRDHATDLPKKIRRLAMRMALSAKQKNGQLVELDKAEAGSHKTREMANALQGLGVDNAVIVSDGEIETNFARATRNLPEIDVLPTEGANVYDILRRDTLVLTRQAAENLNNKLKG